MVLNRLLRAGEARTVRRLGAIADYVDTFADEVEALSDAELRAKTEEFRDRYADGESLDDLLPRGVRRRPRGAPPAPSASGTTTCSSWAAPRCTSATSPR